MLLMDGTDVERRFQSHLTKLIGDVDGELWGHKHLANFQNFEDFHRLAQTMEIKRISYDGDLVFRVWTAGDTWTCSLDVLQRDNFLSKYRNQYQIVPV